MNAVDQFTCEVLSYEEWEQLVPIFNEEFNSHLPRFKYGAIVALKEGEKIIGFVSLESIMLISLAYLKPEYRHTNARNVLFEFVESVAKDRKGSAMIITEPNKANRLMKKYGLTERGQAWRIDF